MENSAPPPASPGSNNPLVQMTAQSPAQAAQAGQAAPAAPQAPQYRPEDDPIWIEKGRQIIRRTSGDPYTRHDAINKLKLQYLAQRFSMNIGEKDH